MRHALHVRVAAIAVGVSALTLVIAALVTQELIQVGYRQELDRVLSQELDEVRLGLPTELREAAGDDGEATTAEVDAAAQRYLAVHPGSDRHLMVFEIGSRQLSTRDGPPELLRLQRLGTLPAGTLGSLRTVDSPAGPVRILSAPLTNATQTIGTVTVVGPLSEGRHQSRTALVRIALAGGIGLAVGGVILVFAVRRALQPVRALAVAARSVDLSDLKSRVPDQDRQDEVGVMAREFNRMLDRVSDDEEQRQRLLSAISHELRSPLAVARGHLELFETLGARPGYSATDTAAVVRRELDRLGRIVEDLTALNQGEVAGATARDPVFAPDVLDALAHRVEGLDLPHVNLGVAPPVVLLGDEDRLTQALLNLVVNARTHTPAGTQVSVQSDLRADRIVFRVIDDGPGIAPEVLPRVFEPFVTTKEGGPSRSSGLGLAVVKAVTEAQGGEVTLDSGPQGTTVSLAFPVNTGA
ncbi:ATP-binding protein [uncultured Friedmanniella sp.]|uniref:sensor histidine kinase n=1 Tax=uncultured Friedmanniella sp. TaxID=335381 RepID=UPI0035CC03BE